MSSFGEQLQTRVRNDGRSLEDNLQKLGEAINGKERKKDPETPAVQNTIGQMESICRYLGIETPENPRECEDPEEQMDVILRPSGAAKRRVELNDIWWKNGDGPLLAFWAESGKAVALIPSRFRGYHYTDKDSGKKIFVSTEKKDLFEKEAWCFYRPLPNSALTGREYVGFLLRQLNRDDVLLLVLAMIIYTMLGTISTYGTQYAFSDVIPSGQSALLVSLGVLLVSASIGKWLLSITRQSASTRMSTRLSSVMENAVFARVIRLPASFFSDTSAGGLSSRISALNQVPTILISVLFGAFLSMAVSLIYVAQLFTISKPLVLPVFTVYLSVIVIFVLTVLQEKRQIEAKLAGEEKNSGLIYAFISGIQKLKVSGSEDRAFAKWMEAYTERTRPAYRILYPSSIRSPLLTAIQLIGLLWLYVIAYNNNLSMAAFTAFSSAFGMAMSGVSALSSAGTSVASLSPIMKIAEPILQTEPEATSGKREIHSLSGNIELSHVTFRYTEDGPAILDDFDLTVEPGDYLAVVGKTGCGKSTLMRLLLGFEDPQAGAVYYDGLDLESLDKHSLRRHIGTVLQNGKLFSGDIYSNITLTTRRATEDDAWEAAEKAGLADDIRKMPMGMYTMISEGSGGISGGQRQRILIARAICPKPSVLILDEATSALDNVTQKVVTENLNAMNCTRIVIAHRLSTIKECSRIIVLDGGKIVEDGTYDELLAKDGFFAELVKRQLLEETDKAV